MARETDFSEVLEPLRSTPEPLRSVPNSVGCAVLSSFVCAYLVQDGLQHKIGSRSSHMLAFKECLEVQWQPATQTNSILPPEKPQVIADEHGIDPTGVQ